MSARASGRWRCELLQVVLGRGSRPRERAGARDAPRGVSRRRGCLRNQAFGRARRRAVGLRRTRHRQRRALHCIGRPSGAGARVPGALSPRRAAGCGAVNSGNANAATGRAGLGAATRMQGAAAVAARVDPELVAVASTGVIGVALDGAALSRGLASAAFGCAPTATRPSATRSAPPTRSPSASRSTWSCPAGACG